MSVSRFSDYEERIRQTPRADSGRWEGLRGESKCRPFSAESQAALASKGIDGITYQDGEPDFSPLSESTVKIGNMNAERFSKNVRYGRDSSLTTYGSYDQDGNPIKREDPHKVDKNSLSEINMKYANPGNFNQADILTAQKWNEEKRDGKAWRAEDVKEYRQEHDLTWHECNDGETMMLVPSAVNSDFGHLGGVGEMKRRQEIVDEVNEQFDREYEGDPYLEDYEDYLSEEERAFLNKLNTENNRQETQENDADIQIIGRHKF